MSTISGSPLFSPRIDLAIRIASVGHALDVRKGTALPYIAHPVSVARLLERDGWPEDVVIAGYLHQVLSLLGLAFLLLLAGLEVEYDRFRGRVLRRTAQPRGV